MDFKGRSRACRAGFATSRPDLALRSTACPVVNPWGLRPGPRRAAAHWLGEAANELNGAGMAERRAFDHDRPIAMVLAMAGGWAITEWLRATMFTGFAWNPVGVTLVDSSTLGAGRWIGTYGLSALVVLSAGALLLTG